MRTPKLSELDELSSDEGRLVNLSLAVKRRSTGERILLVGGMWDRVSRQYVGPAKRSHVVYVNEAQVEPARALAAWLKRRVKGEPREVLHFLGVKRGGGKSHWCVAATIIAMVALSGALCWAVSPTHARRDELERIFRSLLPRRFGWWLWKGQPDYRFSLVNGSALRLLSGEIPDSVRQGGAEVVFLNELQDMDRRVFSLGLPAVRNVEGRPAGIMLIAANPPTRARGEHVNELAQKIMAREVEGGLYFDVDPRLNTALERGALDQVEGLVEAIDPTVARADLSGEWLPVGDRAYPMWRSRDRVVEGQMRRSLVGELPDLGYRDVTSEVLKKTGALRSGGRYYTDVLACDFQGRPHMAAVGARIYRRPDGQLLYYVRHTFIVQGQEIDLSDEIQESGLYNPDTAAMVGDASGEWQSGRHGKRDLPSFEAMRSYRWAIFPPREKILAESKHPSNPPVERSLGEMYAVMRDDRLFVHPSCAWLIEALEKCPLQREGAKPRIPGRGGYSHVTDCVRYLVHRFEPKPGPAQRKNPLEGILMIQSFPKGPRSL
jgi:hypothetical protein